ncbi:GNAT family N-acetyltransferase [Wenyingzhuangia sp. IMCC45574]
MNIIKKRFEELSTTELYKILQLRFEVFVVEQQCIYNEFDDKDYISTHYFIQQNESIIAYLRVYKKDAIVASFGRVVIHKSQRKKGLANLLIQTVIEDTQQKVNVEKIVIEAQEHLKDFYAVFGFRQVSEPYDDCGIMHIDMELESSMG